MGIVLSAVKIVDNVACHVAARNHLRNILLNILRQLESGNCDSDTFDHVQYRLDCLHRIIRRCFDAGFLGEIIDFLTSRAFDQKTKRTTFRKSSERVVTVVKEALDCFELNDTSVMYHAGKVFIYLFYLFIFQILALHR